MRWTQVDGVTLHDGTPRYAPLELVVQNGQRVLQELVRAALQHDLRRFGLGHELHEVPIYFQELLRFQGHLLRNITTCVKVQSRFNSQRDTDTCP